MLILFTIEFSRTLIIYLADFKFQYLLALYNKNKAYS